MFGPKCRFRPIALEALQKAGRTWEIVYVGGSLNFVQTGVEADLGLSVLSPLSLTQGIVIAGNSSSLLTLPTAHLAICSPCTPSPPIVPLLTTFLGDSCAD